MTTLSKPLIAFAAAFGAIAATGAAIGQAAPAPNGETLFRQRCAMCHANVAGRPATLGPNLVGLAGRKAGSTPFNYSPALKKSNITWTRAELDSFLAAPARKVPGTRMVIAVTDPAQRAAIVTYLTRPAR